MLPPPGERDGSNTPRHLSSSSLSTYNLSKGIGNGSDATAAMGPSFASSPAQTNAPLHSCQSNRSLLYSQLGEQPISRRQHPMHPAPQVHHRRKHNNSRQNQYEEQTHPQAGAEAILGRRKSSASSTGGASTSNINNNRSLGGNAYFPYRRRSSEGIPILGGEFPSSITEFDRVERNVMENNFMGNDLMRRDAMGNRIVNDARNSFKSQEMGTGSLGSGDKFRSDRMDSFGIGDGMNSFGTNDMLRRDLNNIQASMYDSFGTNEMFRRDLNNEKIQAETTMSPRAASLHEQDPRMSQITDSSSEYNIDNIGKNARSAAIPIPTARNMFGRSKRITKSYSRSDLVREMALDRNHRSNRNTGSTNTLNEMDSASSNNNSPRRNSSFVSLKDVPENIEGSVLDLPRKTPSPGESPKISTSPNPPSSPLNPVAAAAAAAAVASGVSFADTTGPSSIGLDASQSKMSLLSSSLARATATTSAAPVPSPSINSINLQTSALPASGLHSIMNEQLSAVPTQNRNSTAYPQMSATQNRNSMMSPSLLPYHPQQEHLIRASNLSKRTSIGSHSTVETGNMTSRRSNVETSDPLNQNVYAALGAATVAKQMGSNADCNRCAQMEMTLLSLQADVEYLRTLELQREFVCMQCETSAVVPKNQSKGKKTSVNLPSKRHPPSIPENMSSAQSESSAVSAGSRGSSRLPSSKLNRASSKSIGGASRSSVRTSLLEKGSRTADLLRDASKRLGDLSTRHKRQVKQSTHERAFWQNDMHLKLEKFALMAKNLNEEAAKRNNEVKETQASLEKVSSERNGLLTQLEMLKARVALYEEESTNHATIHKQWENDEMKALAAMEQTRKDQDAIIKDLALRLNLAMKTIETERRQHQQRRQIIFPASRQNSSMSTGGTNSPSSPHQRPSSALPELTKSEELEGIKKTAKETVQKYQMLLDSAMAQSASREKEMQTHLEALEQELREEKLKNSKHGGELDVMKLTEGHSSDRGRVSSSASL